MQQLSWFVCFVLCFASARAAYTCGENDCSTSNGYDRLNVIACRQFCYYDVIGDLALRQFGFEQRFNEWLVPPATAVDLATFTAVYEREFPELCATEIQRIFFAVAVYFGDSALITIEDVELWYNDVVTTYAGGLPPIYGDQWQAYWLNIYPLIGDPTCPNPLP